MKSAEIPAARLTLTPYTARSGYGIKNYPHGRLQRPRYSALHYQAHPELLEGLHEFAETGNSASPP